MIQPKYNKQNNTIFLGFDSLEINLVSLIKMFAHFSIALFMPITKMTVTQPQDT